jgi:hypothetical protein
MKAPRLNKLTSRTLIALLVAFSTQIIPSWAFPTYSAQYEVALNGGQGWMVRGGGNVYIVTSSRIRKISESTGLLSSTSYDPNYQNAMGGTVYPDEMVYHNGDNLYALTSTSRVFKLNPNGSGTPNATPYDCGVTNTSSGIAGDSSWLFVTCSGDRTLKLNDEVGQNGNIQSLQTVWTPGKVVLANGFAYIANLSSPYDIKKINLTQFAANPNTATITSITVPNDIVSSSLSLKMTSDSNYIWVTSGTSGNPVKVARISIADNSVSTITLSGYTAGSSAPAYRVGQISSDNSTLYIAFNQHPKVIGVNTADLTWALLATPAGQTDIWGIQATSDGFWVSGDTKTFKFIKPATVTTDASAEARRKRQAEIDAARNSLVQKIKAGDTVVNPDFIAADVQQFNAEISKKANADFQVAAKAKDFGFPNVRTVITKWGIYQDIENGVRSTVTGRTASAAGIIPAGVVQKQLLISRVQNVAPAQRATVEQIDKLISDFAAIDAARKAKLAEVLKRRSN